MTRLHRAVKGYCHTEMKRILKITAGPDAGRSFTVTDEKVLVVGRGHQSDTRIDDPRISRLHCRLIPDGARTWLVDAGSASGVRVNGKTVQRSEIQPGDVIQLGDSTMVFRLKSGPEASTLSEPALPRESIDFRDLVGESLGEFHLDSLHADGRSGVVFKATDTNFDRPAAVKVLFPRLIQEDGQKERFVRAMRTMIDVRDQNVVELYGAGRKQSYCWCAMEFIEGENLTEVIRRLGIQGMLDWKEVWKVAVHVARGLKKIHDQKIVHRNLTPTSILRRHSDKVCLLGDVMLAKALDGTLAKQVTAAGQLVGELPYMAPESTHDSMWVDIRSDIYGLGATCFALLTGRPPFEAASTTETVQMIRNEEPRKPREFQLSVNELFQDCVLRMLAKKPADRFKDPSELVSQLYRIGTYNNLEADWSEWRD